MTAGPARSAISASARAIALLSCPPNSINALGPFSRGDATAQIR
jgi:hypothetical protein